VARIPRLNVRAGAWRRLWELRGSSPYPYLILRRGAAELAGVGLAGGGADGTGVGTGTGTGALGAGDGLGEPGDCDGVGGGPPICTWPLTTE